MTRTTRTVHVTNAYHPQSGGHGTQPDAGDRRSA